MRNMMRTFVVGLLVVAMSVGPAAACGCHGYYGGGYAAYGPAYYGSVSYGGCCGYASGYYGYYDDCGGCGGCGPYGAYDSYDGVVVEGAPGGIMPAPTPPRDDTRAPTLVPAPRQPATVDRPMDSTPPPQLPQETFVPPAPEPAATQPVPTTPPPAENDLFSAPVEEPAETPAPTEQPVESPAEETNDLFGPTMEPTETPPPAESTIPTETPPPAEETDALFGEPSATGTTEETPAETEEEPAEAPAEEATEEDDGIFGHLRDVLREPGGLASTEMRYWVDNTGSYSCHGRLIRFLDGHVRLLKDNGRTTTVPLYRLSASDLEFVNRQARASEVDGFQTAQSDHPMLLAN